MDKGKIRDGDRVIVEVNYPKLDIYRGRVVGYHFGMGTADGFYVISLDKKQGKIAAEKSNIGLAEDGLYKKLKSSMEAMYGGSAEGKVLSMEPEQTNRYDAGVG